jgi:YD repeat-containing protein
VTNAVGKTTAFTYDAFDNKLTETDPLGNTTRFTYNNLRRLITITDPRGAVTNNAYDNAGRVLSTSDALGNTTLSPITWTARLPRKRMRSTIPPAMNMTPLGTSPK